MTRGTTDRSAGRYRAGLPTVRPAANGRSSATKLAAAVAEWITTDIADAGWPEGTVLGSEAGLLERYGVSRAVFREAVRIVEVQHAARMRRGPGGGLMVVAPSVDAVVDAVSVYLCFVGARVDEVFEARIALESAAAELAPERLTEAGIGALRSLVEREQQHAVSDYRELHSLVASITGNPALELFVDLLNRATFLYLAPRTRTTTAVAEASAAAHAAIASAILRGDAGLARSRMRKHLTAEEEFLRGRRRGALGLARAPVVGRTDKLPELTARRIFGLVIDAGWPVGRLLGSEAALMNRYGVSRAVLREAIRLLEHHQIAQMRRGPGGGLFVAEPGVEATTAAIALHVERNGVTPRHLFEVRVAVEMAVLDRVLSRLDGAGAAALQAALVAEQTASREEFVTVGHDLHAVLADVSGNRVLQLLTQVLLRLARRRSAAPADATDPLPTGEVTRAHEGIVQAIVAHDRELARYRARRHLSALERWIR